MIQKITWQIYYVYFWGVFRIFGENKFKNNNSKTILTKYDKKKSSWDSLMDHADELKGDSMALLNLG